MALTPQVLIYQGIVWKDVMFANCAVAGLICIAHAARRWDDRPRRWTLLITALVALELVGLFVIFHLFDLTWGAANPHFVRGDPYDNLFYSFGHQHVGLTQRIGCERRERLHAFGQIVGLVFHAHFGLLAGGRREGPAREIAARRGLE